VRKVIETKEKLFHEPVLLKEILNWTPSLLDGFLLDVTAGGGGHFFEILKKHNSWRGECWDRDPEAEARIISRAQQQEVSVRERASFCQRRFGEGPHQDLKPCSFILADIGVSSFQIDDPERGMSLFSESPPDFRMNPQEGIPFKSWLAQTSDFDLARIFADYGEEPRARKLAQSMKQWGDDAFVSAKSLAEHIRAALSYSTPSRTHPATRAFQAMRIAINNELGELESLLKWAPLQLSPGGRIAVISFHSLEDRIVKNSFRRLAQADGFDILTKKPIEPSDEEVRSNPRSRSSKLRVLERRCDGETGASP
jgi:16S rRNA (cytosine1402-N4)-methyltransferase